MSDDEPSPAQARIAGAMVAFAGVLLLSFTVTIGVPILLMTGAGPWGAVAGVGIALFPVAMLVGVGWPVARGRSDDLDSVVSVGVVVALTLVTVAVLLSEFRVPAAAIGGSAAYFLTSVMLAVSGGPSYRAWRAGRR